MYYINIFFTYSFIGHLLEKLLNPKNTSGILFGFWTPIYGIGSIIIIYIYKKFLKTLSIKKWQEIVITFFIGFIFLSTIEWIGGFLIEKIFNTSLWDYSKMKFNIGKYASLEMALIWGLASIILIYIIQPVLEKTIIKIPKWSTKTLIFLFIMDLILTTLLKTK